jgi:hypothetical protein
MFMVDYKTMDHGMDHQKVPEVVSPEIGQELVKVMDLE